MSGLTDPWGAGHFNSSLPNCVSKRCRPSCRYWFHRGGRCVGQSPWSQKHQQSSARMTDVLIKKHLCEKVCVVLRIYNGFVYLDIFFSPHFATQKNKHFQLECVVIRSEINGECALPYCSICVLATSCACCFLNKPAAGVQSSKIVCTACLPS